MHRILTSFTIGLFLETFPTQEPLKDVRFTQEKAHEQYVTKYVLRHRTFNDVSGWMGNVCLSALIDG